MRCAHQGAHGARRSGQLVEALIDDRQALVQLGIRRGHRHQHAQHVAVGAARQQDQPLVARLGDDLPGQRGVGLGEVTVLEQLAALFEEDSAPVQRRLAIAAAGR